MSSFFDDFEIKPKYFSLRKNIKNYKQLAMNADSSNGSFDTVLKLLEI